jgi:hypothetical protein
MSIIYKGHVEAREEASWHSHSGYNHARDRQGSSIHAIKSRNEGPELGHSQVDHHKQAGIQHSGRRGVRIDVKGG